MVAFESMPLGLMMGNTLLERNFLDFVTKTERVYIAFNIVLVIMGGELLIIVRLLVTILKHRTYLQYGVN